MTCRLAVFAPSIGAASETFVFRHMERLLPGETACVVGSRTAAPRWAPTGPVLVLDDLNPRALESLSRRALRHIGIPVVDPHHARVVRFLRRQGVQVVLGEWLDWTTPWIETFRRVGIRCVAHAHGYDVSERWLADERIRERYRTLAAAAAIVTVSEVTRRRLRSAVPASVPIQVVPCGVEIPLAIARPSSDGLVHCLAVGRMVAKKSPILLLESFRRASQNDSRLRLDYVGAGELFSAAADFVSAFSLMDRVILHGERSHTEVLGLISQAQIFIQHSITGRQDGDEEGLPVAILEAMAAGLPIVSTRHAGIPEAVSDGVHGFLVAEGDVAGMADRLLALARDPELRASIGASCRSEACARFSWETERASLLAILGFQASAGVDRL